MQWTGSWGGEGFALYFSSCFELFLPDSSSYPSVRRKKVVCQQDLKGVGRDIVLWCVSAPYFEPLNFALFLANLVFPSPRLTCQLELAVVVFLRTIDSMSFDASEMHAN